MQASPVGLRVGIPPGHQVLAIDGPWPRRHLLTPDAVALITSLDRPRTLGRRTVPGATLVRMVLDGLLEVEIDGRFRAGGAAHRRLFKPRRSPSGWSRILGLSHTALCLASLRDGQPAHELADRLYQFNSQPRSPRWLRRCPHDAAAAALLSPPSAASELDTAISGPWRVWDAPERAHLPQRGRAPTFKLYVSSAPASTQAAATALLDTLRNRGGPVSCKLGQDVPSVLRPDRLVAYFDDPESLRATAALLRHTLAGMPAQGVPFTAPLDRRGLLSWGADFAVSGDLGGHPRERSWRGWVTSRLATALVAADRSGAPDRVAFALDRVALDGVNVGNWAPTTGLLRQHGGRSIDAAA